jgi:hypothetical protein
MTKRSSHLPPLLVLVLLAVVAPPARAQSGDGASLSGSAQLGFRSVDVTGREQKYLEDINLTDGPRLFRFDLNFTPSTGLRSAVDKVEVNANNLGGDPFELLRVSVKKYGRYTLKYDRRKSSYFYDDIILPLEVADPALDDEGDLHRFDFDRVRDTASLRLRLGSAAKLTLGFDRYTKKGHSATTIDVQRDLFEFEQPVDERMQDYVAGFEYAWKKVTLSFEERIRQYDNVVEIHLPGQSLGANPEDATVLDFFFLDRPYDFTSFTHTARLLGHPNDRLIIRAAASLTDLDLDLAVRESSKGTTFQGVPIATEASGEGGVERDMALFDLDLSYLLSERWSVFGGVRRHELDQDGQLSLEADVEDGGVPEPAHGDSSWAIETTNADAGLRWLVSRQVTLSGGLRYEDRKVASAWDYEEGVGGTDQDTQSTGFFTSLGWRASRRFRFRAGYEDSAFDGPYTLASPTTRRIFRLRAQYGGGQGLSLSGSLRVNRNHNSDSGWRADLNTLNLRLGYRIAAFSASLGYSHVGIERSIDQTVTTLPGFGGGVEFLVPVAYDVTADSIDARLIWSFADRWRLGGLARLYESEGSWAVNRDDLRVWVEVQLGERYVAHAGFRNVDYVEPVRGFNDYQANIGELSIGYRW